MILTYSCSLIHFSNKDIGKLKYYFKSFLRSYIKIIIYVPVCRWSPDHKCSEDFLDLKKGETGRIDTRMTRIEQIVTDFWGTKKIRSYPPNPRHPCIYHPLK